MDDIIEIILEVASELFFATKDRNPKKKHPLILTALLVVIVLLLGVGAFHVMAGERDLGIVLVTLGVFIAALMAWSYRKVAAQRKRDNA